MDTKEKKTVWGFLSFKLRKIENGVQWHFWRNFFLALVLYLVLLLPLYLVYLLLFQCSQRAIGCLLHLLKYHINVPCSENSGFILTRLTSLRASSLDGIYRRSFRIKPVSVYLKIEQDRRHWSTFVSDCFISNKTSQSILPKSSQFSGTRLFTWSMELTLSSWII